MKGNKNFSKLILGIVCIIFFVGMSPITKNSYESITGVFCETDEELDIITNILTDNNISYSRKNKIITFDSKQYIDILSVYK